MNLKRKTERALIQYAHDIVQNTANKCFCVAELNNNTAGLKLEEVMQIPRNSSKASDTQFAEIKTSKTTSSSPLTLSAPTPSRFAKDIKGIYDVVLAYGNDSKDKKRKNLYRRLSSSNNRKSHSKGRLTYKVEEGSNGVKEIRILWRHATGQERFIASWPLNAIVDQIYAKLSHLVYNKWTQTTVGESKAIRYDRVYALKMKSKAALRNLIEDGTLTIELRAHIALDKSCMPTTLRDHGTAFRVTKANMPKLFDELCAFDVPHDKRRVTQQVVQTTLFASCDIKGVCKTIDDGCVLKRQPLLFEGNVEVLIDSDFHQSSESSSS